MELLHNFVSHNTNEGTVWIVDVVKLVQVSSVAGSTVQADVVFEASIRCSKGGVVASTNKGTEHTSLVSLASHKRLVLHVRHIAKRLTCACKTLRYCVPGAMYELRPADPAPVAPA